MKLVRFPESLLLWGVAEYIKMCNKIQFTKAQSEFHVNNLNYIDKFSCHYHIWGQIHTCIFELNILL